MASDGNDILKKDLFMYLRERETMSRRGRERGRERT